MINLIPTFIQLWTILIVQLLIFISAYMLTHHPNFNLMQLNMFNLKPLNCNVCLNWWLTVLVAINFAYLSPYYLVWFGIGGILTTYAIYYDNTH